MKKKDELKIFLGTLIPTIVMFLILVALAPIPSVGAEVDISSQWYIRYAVEMGLDDDFCEMVGIDADYINLCQPDELTDAFVVSYEDTDVVVEKIIGVCVDEARNGEILNTADKNHNYIHYGNNIGVGDIVLSYCIYDVASSTEEDVIIDRYDYIIDTDQLIEEIG